MDALVAGKRVRSSAKLVRAFWHQVRWIQFDKFKRWRHSWAVIEVNQAASCRSPGIVELLVDLADAAHGDPEALGYLGAGPIAELLRFGEGELTEAIVSEIDDAAQRDLSFRFALQCVSWSESDDPALRARLQRFGQSV